MCITPPISVSQDGNWERTASILFLVANSNRRADFIEVTNSNKDISEYKFLKVK
jgi:hypothetical protein